MEVYNDDNEVKTIFVRHMPAKQDLSSSSPKQEMIYGTMILKILS